MEWRVEVMEAAAEKTPEAARSWADNLMDSELC